MSQTITAIYADGLLRPLAPLALPEQAEVEIEIRPLTKPNGAGTAATDERAHIHQILVAAGLVTAHAPVPAPSPPISAEEEERLGRLFAVGKPLSEIIIEEREDRF